MRATKTYTLLLLTLLAFTLAPAISPSPASAETQYHEAIRIARDSDFVIGSNGVTGGSGTAQNPYIIENWDINATTGVDQGSIHVLNTRKYFIIRNVYIHPTSLLREASGIRFLNVENGRIENVRVTNATYGVWIASSANNALTNSTIYGNTNGVYLTSTQGLTVTDNIIHHSIANFSTGSPQGGYGFWISSTSASLIARNNSYNNTQAGFIITQSQDNLFDSNTSTGNTDAESNPRGYGFRIISSQNNTFSNNTVSSNPFGIVFESSHNNTATRNLATLGLYGLGLECVGSCTSQTGNTFKSNTAIENQYGIYVVFSTNNTIYDNFLRNCGPRSCSNAYDNTGDNAWNITRTLGTNILGGPLLGGNYYSNYTQTDLDNDGFNDTPYKITGDPCCPIFDMLPLVLQQPNVVHDLAATATNIQPSSGKVGATFTITVTIRNLGTTPESTTVTAQHGQRTIGSQAVTNLPAGASTSLTFTWNTDGLSAGDYSITGSTATFTGEINTQNNNSPPTTVTLDNNASPVASFTASTINTTSGQAIMFDASASYDSDGTIQSYSWSFADGQTASGPTATHSYNLAKDYMVTLTVTDDNGATGTAQKRITVRSNTPSEPTNLQISYSNSRILLTWTAPTDNGGSAIIGYNIYRGVNPSLFQKIAQTGNVLTYEDTQISNGQAYYYKVSAVNMGQMEGPQSSQRDITVPLPTGPSPPPASDNTLLYAGLAALLVVLILLAAVTVGRRRQPGI